MNNIKYLKHCTFLGNLETIFKDGYLRSQKDLKANNFDLNISKQDPTKIFISIVSCKTNPTTNFAGTCILLCKQILIDRNDYMINQGYIGHVNKKSSKKLFKKIKPNNEVLFDHKISLKKYIKGVIIGIYFDDIDNYRIDLVYKLTLKSYIQVMHNICSSHKEVQLRKQYKKCKQLLNVIETYTNNIMFTYLPIYAPSKKKLLKNTSTPFYSSSKKKMYYL